MDKIKYIVNVLIIAILLATVAIVRDGNLGGHSTKDLVSASSMVEEVEEVERVESAERTEADGTRIINSTYIAKDVIGFGGRTPVELYIKDDKIEKVVFLDNDETPSFFKEVESSNIANVWQGMSLQEAAVASVDAISGATYTSIAIIENVRRAAQYGASVEPQATNVLASIGIKEILGILVLMLGAVLTLLKSKNKLMITIQLLLNVTVLGFWCGSFLSMSTLTSWLANGINLSMSIVTVVMLGIVLVMPLLGRKGSYCHLHCPMGSAQELLGRIPVGKLKLKSSVNKALNNLRYFILIGLLFTMWLGVGFEIMDYEIFSAFIFQSASTIVLVMAVVFLILSIFIPRPYCRFICPTGALITMSQKTK